MRKAILVPLIALTAFGLAGCSKKAPNEALEANESVAGDSNAMGEAVADQDDAMNAAFSNTETAYDSAPSVNTTGSSNTPAEGSGDE